MSEDALLSVVLDVSEREPNAQFEAERQAFWNQFHELLQQYAGRYVAVHRGQVIDSDEDERRLIRRVYETLGYVPVYIQRVSPEGLPRYRMPTPFVRRP
jgi:hypothetical protein